MGGRGKPVSLPRSKRRSEKMKKTLAVIVTVGILTFIGYAHTPVVFAESSKTVELVMASAMPEKHLLALILKPWAQDMIKL